MKSTTITFRGFLIISLFLLSYGIAHSSQSDEKSLLENRVTVFMQAKNDNNWDVVYDLFDSKFKNRISKESFERKSRGLHFGDYSIKDINITEDGKSAIVHIMRSFSMQGKRFENQPGKQRWIKEKEQWFKVGKSFEDAFSKK